MSIPFETVWTYIQNHLLPELFIRNWTVPKGYFGEDFPIRHVHQDVIAVDPPGAITMQVISRVDFQAVWEVWADYKQGKVQRKTITEMTRYSKYMISIFHWYEMEVPHG